MNGKRIKTPDSDVALFWFLCSGSCTSLNSNTNTHSRVFVFKEKKNKEVPDRLENFRKSKGANSHYSSDSRGVSDSYSEPG